MCQITGQLRSVIPLSGQFTLVKANQRKLYIHIHQAPELKVSLPCIHLTVQGDGRVKVNWMCCHPSQQLSSCSSCRQGCHPQPAVPEHSYNDQNTPRIQIWFSLKAEKCCEDRYCHVLPPPCLLHYITRARFTLRVRSNSQKVTFTIGTFTMVYHDTGNRYIPSYRQRKWHPLPERSVQQARQALTDGAHQHLKVQAQKQPALSRVHLSHFQMAEIQDHRWVRGKIIQIQCCQTSDSCVKLIKYCIVWDL